MDRERYIPGDQVLHPGTGRTEHYQDANGAVFRQTRHDAHGNNFTTSYALDPAIRYGYSGPGGPQRSPYGPDPAAQYGYTVLGGVAPQAPHASRPQASPGWAPAPRSPYPARDLGARIGGATGNARPAGSDGAALIVFLAIAVVAAGWPLGIAYLMRKHAKARGRDSARAAIAIGLTEVSWLLLLWHWLAHGPLWPSLAALVLPVGYTGWVRWSR